MDLEQTRVIIWVVFAGICCAAFYAYYQRRILGDIVRAFIASDAFDEQSAKTLDEIGCVGKLRRALAAFVLRDGTTLRRTIKAVASDEKPSSRRHKDEIRLTEYFSDNGRRYYIPSESCHIAELRYDAKGTNATSLLLTVAVFFAAAVIIIAFLPQIERLVMNFLSAQKP